MLFKPPGCAGFVRPEWAKTEAPEKVYSTPRPPPPKEGTDQGSRKHMFSRQVLQEAKAQETAMSGRQ